MSAEDSPLEESRSRSGQSAPVEPADKEKEGALPGPAARQDPDQDPPGPAPESPLGGARGGATRLGAGLVRHGATILHVLSLAVAFVVLLVLDRRMWFRVDDFEFLSKRGLHGATLSIWYPHAEHWSTIPILEYRALFSIYGLRTAKPYLVVLFLAHLVLAHLLWRAIRAWGTQPAVATALAAIFALLGAGGTNILWEFQIGYVASLLLGWSFILLVNHDGGLSRHDVFGAVAATAALMTSGVAVSMVVVGGLVAMGRRGWRAGVVAVVPPGIVYLVWFVLIGHAGFRLAGPWQRTVRAVPAFVFTGLISAFSDAVGSRLFGPVVLIGLALWALRRWNLIRTAACPALMGLVGTVVFLVITSFGRDFGSAALNRYVYVVVALLLPAAGLALSYVIARRKGRLIAVLGLLVLVGIANLGQLVTLRNRYTSQSLTTERQIIAAARIAAVEPVIADSRPAANVDAPDLYISVLKVFTRNGDLPTGVHPGPLSVVNAATEIQLG